MLFCMAFCNLHWYSVVLLIYINYIIILYQSFQCTCAKHTIIWHSPVSHYAMSIIVYNIIMLFKKAGKTAYLLIIERVSYYSSPGNHTNLLFHIFSGQHSPNSLFSSLNSQSFTYFLKPEPSTDSAKYLSIMHLPLLRHILTPQQKMLLILNLLLRIICIL